MAKPKVDGGWRTINGAKVHFGTNGLIDMGPPHFKGKAIHEVGGAPTALSIMAKSPNLGAAAAYDAFLAAGGAAYPPPAPQGKWYHHHKSAKAKIAAALAAGDGAVSMQAAPAAEQIVGKQAAVEPTKIQAARDAVASFLADETDLSYGWHTVLLNNLVDATGTNTLEVYEEGMDSAAKSLSINLNGDLLPNGADPVVFILVRAEQLAKHDNGAKKIGKYREAACLELIAHFGMSLPPADGEFTDNFVDALETPVPAIGAKLTKSSQLDALPIGAEVKVGPAPWVKQHEGWHEIDDDGVVSEYSSPNIDLLSDNVPIEVTKLPPADDFEDDFEEESEDILMTRHAVEEFVTHAKDLSYGWHNQLLDDLEYATGVEMVDVLKAGIPSASEILPSNKDGDFLPDAANPVVFILARADQLSNYNNGAKKIGQYREVACLELIAHLGMSLPTPKISGDVDDLMSVLFDKTPKLDDPYDGMPGPDSDVWVIKPVVGGKLTTIQQIDALPIGSKVLSGEVTLEKEHDGWHMVYGNGDTGPTVYEAVDLLADLDGVTVTSMPTASSGSGPAVGQHPGTEDEINDLPVGTQINLGGDIIEKVSTGDWAIDQGGGSFYFDADFEADNIANSPNAKLVSIPDDDFKADANASKPAYGKHPGTAAAKAAATAAAKAAAKAAANSTAKIESMPGAKPPGAKKPWSGHFTASAVSKLAELGLGGGTVTADHASSVVEDLIYKSPGAKPMDPSSYAAPPTLIDKMFISTDEIHEVVAYNVTALLMAGAEFSAKLPASQQESYLDAIHAAALHHAFAAADLEVPKLTPNDVMMMPGFYDAVGMKAGLPDESIGSVGKPPPAPSSLAPWVLPAGAVADNHPLKTDVTPYSTLAAAPHIDGAAEAYDAYLASGGVPYPNGKTGKWYHDFKKAKAAVKAGSGAPAHNPPPMPVLFSAQSTAPPPPLSTKTGGTGASAPAVGKHPGTVAQIGALPVGTVIEDDIVGGIEKAPSGSWFSTHGIGDLTSHLYFSPEEIAGLIAPKIISLPAVKPAKGSAAKASSAVKTGGVGKYASPSQWGAHAHKGTAFQQIANNPLSSAHVAAHLQHHGVSPTSKSKNPAWAPPPRKTTGASEKYLQHGTKAPIRGYGYTEPKHVVLPASMPNSSIVVGFTDGSSVTATTGYAGGIRTDGLKPEQFMPIRMAQLIANVNLGYTPASAWTQAAKEWADHPGHPTTAVIQKDPPWLPPSASSSSANKLTSQSLKTIEYLPESWSDSQAASHMQKLIGASGGFPPPGTKTALSSYSSSSHDVNTGIRSGGSYNTDKAARLDKATHALTLAEDAVLYRGVSTFPQLDTMIAAGVNLEDMIGSTLTDAAYQSTSAKVNGGFSGKYRFEIRAPAGTRGAYIGPVADGSCISAFPSEYEMLLPRNTTYRLDEAYKQNYGGGWFFRVTVIHQESFEDAKKAKHW